MVLAAAKNEFTLRLMGKAAVTYFRERYCIYGEHAVKDGGT